MKKLHLGCGLVTPEDWINLDGSWNARLAKSPTLKKILGRLRIVPIEQTTILWNPKIVIHDVRKPLPFESLSIDAIYASHLLEHLYLVEAKCLLQDCFRVLSPGGVVRMVVPDLRSIALNYVNQISSIDSVKSDQLEVNPADRMNRQMLFRSATPPSGNIVYRLYSALNDFHTHKWMYDANSLIKYFRWAGFEDVEEMDFLHSRIENIQIVEQADRVLNGAGVCIEGVKPLKLGI